MVKSMYVSAVPRPNSVVMEELAIDLSETSLSKRSILGQAVEFKAAGSNLGRWVDLGAGGARGSWIWHCKRCKTMV
jgi:hypothetical protein